MVEVFVGVPLALVYVFLVVSFYRVMREDAEYEPIESIWGIPVKGKWYEHVVYAIISGFMIPIILFVGIDEVRVWFVGERHVVDTPSYSDSVY